MRIRAGFVSNSSSTSFLIVAKEELTEASLLKLMGVAPQSPLAPMFRELFERIVGNESEFFDFRQRLSETGLERYMAGTRMSDRMREKLREAEGKGLIAYVGSLSSDGTMVEQFFCTDSFEEENDSVYINALECGW